MITFLNFIKINYNSNSYHYKKVKLQAKEKKN